MKCEFCGSENLLNPRAKRSVKPTIVYDSNTQAYWEVMPNQYLICQKCGRTDTFSSLRKLTIAEVESLKYSING